MRSITDEIRDVNYTKLRRIMDDCSDVEDELFFILRDGHMQIISDMSAINPNNSLIW